MFQKCTVSTRMCCCSLGLLLFLFVLLVVPKSAKQLGGCFDTDFRLEKATAIRHFSSSLGGQHGETQIIYENFFSGCQTGKYLEIGGRDGLDGTNTLFFEIELNWTGMMIEACPQAYLKMVKNRSAKKNTFVNGIISNSNPFTLTKFT